MAGSNTVVVDGETVEDIWCRENPGVGFQAIHTVTKHIYISQEEKLQPQEDVTSGTARYKLGEAKGECHDAQPSRVWKSLMNKRGIGSCAKLKQRGKCPHTFLCHKTCGKCTVKRDTLSAKQATADVPAVQALIAQVGGSRKDTCFITMAHGVRKIPLAKVDSETKDSLVTDLGAGLFAGKIKKVSKKVLKKVLKAKSGSGSQKGDKRDGEQKGNGRGKDKEGDQNGRDGSKKGGKVTPREVQQHFTEKTENTTQSDGFIVVEYVKVDVCKTRRLEDRKTTAASNNVMKEVHNYYQNSGLQGNYDQTVCQVKKVILVTKICTAMEAGDIESIMNASSSEKDLVLGNVSRAYRSEAQVLGSMVV